MSFLKGFADGLSSEIVRQRKRRESLEDTKAELSMRFGLQQEFADKERKRKEEEWKKVASDYAKGNPQLENHLYNYVSNGGDISKISDQMNAFTFVDEKGNKVTDFSASSPSPVRPTPEVSKPQGPRDFNSFVTDDNGKVKRTNANPSPLSNEDTKRRVNTQETVIDELSKVTKVDKDKLREDITGSSSRDLRGIVKMVPTSSYRLNQMSKIQTPEQGYEFLQKAMTDPSTDTAYIKDIQNYISLLENKRNLSKEPLKEVSLLYKNPDSDKYEQVRGWSNSQGVVVTPDGKTPDPNKMIPWGNVGNSVIPLQYKVEDMRDKARIVEWSDDINEAGKSVDVMKTTSGALFQTVDKNPYVSTLAADLSMKIGNVRYNFEAFAELAGLKGKDLVEPTEELLDSYMKFQSSKMNETLRGVKDASLREGVKKFLILNAEYTYSYLSLQGQSGNSVSMQEFQTLFDLFTSAQGPEAYKEMISDLNGLSLKRYSDHVTRKGDGLIAAGVLGNEMIDRWGITEGDPEGKYLSRLSDQEKILFSYKRAGTTVQAPTKSPQEMSKEELLSIDPKTLSEEQLPEFAKRWEELNSGE